MLDFVYYPVSGVLWIWHKIFGSLLGPDSGWAWALSVLFLVFTLRALLVRPVLNQMRTSVRMRRMQPHLAELREKHADNPQELLREMRKLHREHGVNPLIGCLPLLAQIPVFIGLFHVLRSFNRTGEGIGQLGMTPELNAATANYFFSAADVQSFLGARLFGAPLSAAVTGPASNFDAFLAFGGAPSLAAVALVAGVLAVTASLVTHVNGRYSLARPAMSENAQMSFMRPLLLWVFPLGAIVSAPFLPIAILLYWVGNNVWTYGQQHVLYRIVDAEEGGTALRPAR